MRRRRRIVDGIERMRLLFIIHENANRLIALLHRAQSTAKADGWSFRLTEFGRHHRPEHRVLDAADAGPVAGVHVEPAAGVVRLLGAHPAHQGDVERKNGAVAKDDDSTARAQRVADAQFIEHVWVRAGNIGYRIVTEHEPLEHWLVNRAADASSPSSAALPRMVIAVAFASAVAVDPP